MADHLIDVLWKSDFVDRQIKDALVGLFGPEPDPGLVRLIRGKTESLSHAEVRSSLGRLRTTFDFPVAASPAAGPVAPPKEAKTAANEPASKGEPASAKSVEILPGPGGKIDQRACLTSARQTGEFRRAEERRDLEARSKLEGGSSRLAAERSVLDRRESRPPQGRKVKRH
jgi:hypothetical protein